jgi:hypothetical protein
MKIAITHPLPEYKSKKKWQEIVRKQNYLCKKRERQLTGDHVLRHKGLPFLLPRAQVKNTLYSRPLA